MEMPAPDAAIVARREEIAAALELPLNTVRSRLHRARLDLKEKLERFLP